MPTYNDSDSIRKSIDSVLNQTYNNIELVIVNDGSSDNTEEVIKSYQDTRIKYIYQKNSDQLNAVKNGFSISDGDIIYILHSDDLFYDRETVESAVTYMEKSDCEALKGDLILINSNDEIIGKKKVRNFSNDDEVLVKMFLLYGINILNDFAFIRREAFKKFSYNNYLTWNTPFWVNFSDDSYEIIKLEQMATPLIKYRIHNENYINNDIGKYNVVNGNLRTLMYLMDKYTVHKFWLQRFLLRWKKDKYVPKYKMKTTHNKYKIIKKAIKFRVGKAYKKNLYLKSLISFYRKSRRLNKKNIDKKIIINSDINSSDIYFGSDLRKFNKQVMNGELPTIYIELFTYMQKGFNIIKTDFDKLNDIKNILKFLNILMDVKVEC